MLDVAPVAPCSTQRQHIGMSPIGFAETGLTSRGRLGSFPTAGLEDPQDRDGQRYGGRLAALADQVQQSLSA